MLFKQFRVKQLSPVKMINAQMTSNSDVLFGK